MSLDEDQQKELLATFRYLSIVDLTWLTRNLVLMLNRKVREVVQGIEVQNMTMYQMLEDMTTAAEGYQTAIHEEIKLTFNNGRVQDKVIDEARSLVSKALSTVPAPDKVNTTNTMNAFTNNPSNQ